MGLNDEERKTIVSLETEKAHRFLGQAESMYCQEQWDMTVNRYYYACFHIVQALFIHCGLSAKTHAGMASTFAQHFIKTGKIDRIHGAVLARLMQLRQIADYNCAVSITREDADSFYTSVSAFVDAVERLIA